MEQRFAPRDFMLIARSIDGSGEFHARIKQALQFAAADRPEVAWRAEFDLGPKEHVEVFTAPDIGTAREVSDMVNTVAGVRIELAPLRNGW
jgi:hypothetical protein